MTQTTSSTNRTPPSGRRTPARGAAVPLTIMALLCVLLSHSGARAQNAPAGPAGGDLSGAYPNPTLAADRVKKTGDTMTGALNISLPNPGTVVTPFTISSGGNIGLNRGTALQFNVPNAAATHFGSQFNTAWGSNSQTYISFSAFSGSGIAEVFRADGRGYFGVGTANPTSRLHVASGTASATTLLFLDTGVAGGTAMSVGATANNESAFDLAVQRGGAYVSRLVVSNHGHLFLQPGGSDVAVGMATAPAHKLDVAGRVNASQGLCIAGVCKSAWSEVAGAGTQWTTAGSNIHFNAGNVGLGTAAPDALLSLRKDQAAATEIRMTNTNASGFAGLYLNSGFTQAAGGFVQWNNTAGANNLFVATGGPSPLYLGTNNGIRVTVLPGSGNVGIGTTAPAEKLHVVGNLSVAGPGNINASGTITGGNIQAKYQDVAEWVPSTQQLAAGTVVVLDTGRSNHVLASSEAYDTRVAGVVSAQPGLILGEGGEGKVMVATTGRVRVKVDATRAPIRIGDLLVTSGAEGVAMRSEPVALGGRKMHSPGTIIGKALEPLEKGVGEILVLLSLQ